MRPSSVPRSRASAAGFTLVELMIAVVVVSVLAVLGVISYRRYIASARISEATHLVGAIREGQERFKTEMDKYADISNGVEATDMYPAKPDDHKRTWGGACTTCKAGMSFDTISVTTAEPVSFGYATVAGPGDCDPDCKGVSITHAGTKVGFPGVKSAWYVVRAMGDNDNDGHYVSVVGTSVNNQLALDESDE